MLTPAHILDGVDPANPRQGGFAFGQDAGEVWHEGDDWNTPGDETDCYRPVRMPVPAICRWAGYVSGYGWSVWGETIPARTRPQARWLQFAHMIEAPYVAIDQPLGAGAILGRCGKTGGPGPGALWAKCHVHNAGRFTRPPSWGFWPSKAAGYDLARIRAEYFPLAPWLAEQEIDAMPDHDAEIARLEAELASALEEARAARVAAADAGGINLTLGEQLEAVRATLAARDSEVGALKAHVIQPQADEIARLNALLAQLETAAPGLALGVQVRYKGGQAQEFLPAPPT